MRIQAIAAVILPLGRDIWRVACFDVDDQVGLETQTEKIRESKAGVYHPFFVCNKHNVRKC